MKNTHETNAILCAPVISEALDICRFWNECLLDIRAERRLIFADDRLPDSRREYCLQNNSDVTAAIRKELASAQEKHRALVLKSLQAANDPIFDCIEKSAVKGFR